jgi:transcription initiation factor TFIID subunit 1, fungi type
MHNMPHAVNVQDSQADEDAQDARLISQILNPEPGQENADLFNPDRELETTALPDAEDFADISDDELPDEEPTTTQLDNGEDSGLNGVVQETQFQEGEPMDDHDLDDLFGEGQFSDNLEPIPNGINGLPHSDDSLPAEPMAKMPSPALTRPQSSSDSKDPSDLAVKLPQEPPAAKAAENETLEEREQRLLFEEARRDLRRREERKKGGGQEEDIPPPPETDAELLATIWPGYSQDEIPRWQSLFPGKRAYYLYKTPVKPPKPIQPTKVNLDLEVDQERLFKTVPGTTRSKRSREEAEENGIIVLAQSADSGQQSFWEEDLETASMHEDEVIGGLTIGDLRILCEDWDERSQASDQEDASTRILAVQKDLEPATQAGGAESAKRRKIDMTEFLQSSVGFDDQLPSFDDPADLTFRLSRRVSLEPSDPNLLIDFNPPTVAEKIPRRVGDPRRNGGFTKKINDRWNISQDKSYDLLKENHSHRVRSTLAKLDVKHSLPALKLQYPFYKVQLSNREARSFHRPTLHVAPGQRANFSRLHKVKRSTLKDKDVSEVYRYSRDLGMGDNSNMLLLEYSEECPTMLSNFGMNSRLINYYRRVDAEDTSRPKKELGETQILLPHDNSPFSIFGNVEPGHTTPTIHNEMFRAPVFRQEPKSTDFLVIRSSTGIDGQQWYLRNLENLYVVGQQFPYMEVPGTHSRKVTDASKTRMKMLSFRIYRKHMVSNARKPWLSHDMIVKHVPGSDIAGNRSKLKEWMHYDKNQGGWVPPAGANFVPDEPTVRSWLAPEQICLLDSMQVGHRHLLDSGFTKDGDEVDDDGEQSFVLNMAPWQTTKNFLKACQGQAMLELHGEGDPSGRGEAFSFIKTSMKGGFKPIGESIEERLHARNQEELGGHKYNVARQQQAYNDTIHRIWDSQIRSLSSQVEHSDTEMDIDDEPEQSVLPGRTPRSFVGTPAATGRSRLDDDTASQFTGFSGAGGRNRVLKISRKKTVFGEPDIREEVIDDRRIINEYLRRRAKKDLEKTRYVPQMGFCRRLTPLLPQVHSLK